MNVVIAGGTGFLGRALTKALNADGHRVTVLTRTVSGPSQVQWDPAKPTGAWIDTVSRADAVVNLAGESITGRRWTPVRKQALRDSRVSATSALATAIAAAGRRLVFLSASGIGVYGTSERHAFTEESPAGSDFLADLCREWERTAMQAAPARARDPVADRRRAGTRGRRPSRARAAVQILRWWTNRLRTAGRLMDPSR